MELIVAFMMYGTVFLFMIGLASFILGQAWIHSEEKRESGLMALFCLPLIISGLFYGIMAAVLLGSIVPNIWLLLVLPLIGFIAGAWRSKVISQRAELKLDNGQTIEKEMMQVLVWALVPIMFEGGFALVRFVFRV